MSTPESFDLIKNVLDTSWEESPLVYENDPEPALGDQQYFLYIEIVGDLLQQDTFGNPGGNEWVEDGAVYVHAMVPDGTGSREARAICGRVSNLFRERPVGDMNFERMSIGSGEPARSFPNFFAMTLSISFNRRDATGS